ncbi:MAG: hypothetical protein HC913_00085 [Microscillaceae bacterium]|nr:hypothetical protein [Microscillaceae bacterium]
MEASASQAENPDVFLGHGIPNFKKAQEWVKKQEGGPGLKGTQETLPETKPNPRPEKEKKKN